MAEGSFLPRAKYKSPKFKQPVAVSREGAPRRRALKYFTPLSLPGLYSQLVPARCIVHTPETFIPRPVLVPLTLPFSFTSPLRLLPLSSFFLPFFLKNVPAVRCALHYFCTPLVASYFAFGYFTRRWGDCEAGVYTPDQKVLRDIAIFVLEADCLSLVLKENT